MGNEYVDIFATKGLEYILVILFLASLVVFWRILNGPTRSAALAGKRPAFSPGEWFRLDDNLLYHQGHTWLRPEHNGVAVVGMDDFAGKLLGKSNGIIIPPVGAKTKQGERGWQVMVGSQPIDVLSPADGVVVERNESLIKNPELANADPFTNGWVMKIKIQNIRSTLRNLFSGSMAHAWLNHDISILRSRMSDDLGIVLQDGGTIINGFAKALSPSEWDAVAKEFLRTGNHRKPTEQEA